MPKMADHDDHDSEPTRAATDSALKQLFLSDDISTAEIGHQILTEADQLCHTRIGMVMQVAGESPQVILEMATHLAVVHLRHRVSDHIDKLNEDAKARRAAEHARMVASIKLLYVAEPPEFLEDHDVHEPISDGHAGLLASWLLGEGWKHD